MVSPITQQNAPWGRENTHGAGMCYAFSDPEDPGIAAWYGSHEVTLRLPFSHPDSTVGSGIDDGFTIEPLA